MATYSGGNQKYTAKGKDWPLQRIVREEVVNGIVKETLACGHTINAKTDKFGYRTNAISRRCRYCQKGEASR